MPLPSNLERLKELYQQGMDADWNRYKENWILSVEGLYADIKHWVEKDIKKGVVKLHSAPKKRVEAYLGEYSTSSLEIVVNGNKYFFLEPVSAIPKEHDGQLRFYMLGNIYKTVNISRRILDQSKYEWILIHPYDEKNIILLDKSQFERLIWEWAGKQ